MMLLPPCSVYFLKFPTIDKIYHRKYGYQSIAKNHFSKT